MCELMSPLGGSRGRQAARSQGSSGNLQVDAQVRVSVSECVYFRNPSSMIPCLSLLQLGTKIHLLTTHIGNRVPIKLYQVGREACSGFPKCSGKPKGTFWPIQCWPVNPQIPFFHPEVSFLRALPPSPSLSSPASAGTWDLFWVLSSLLLLVLGTCSGCKRCSCEHLLQISACGLLWQDRWPSGGN